MISMSRIRESFQLIKNVSVKNKGRKVKFEIALLPDIYLKYIIIGKSDKDYMIGEGEKIIKIKIKSYFYILNYLKIEYIKNKNTIDKLKNQKNSKNQKVKTSSTDIEKILKFIKEIYCTDKFLVTLCNNFTLDKEFNAKESSEKENFINSNKNLWKTFEELSLHAWHRFFNVETLELMIINKKIDLPLEVFNFMDESESSKN